MTSGTVWLIVWAVWIAGTGAKGGAVGPSAKKTLSAIAIDERSEARRDEAVHELEQIIQDARATSATERGAQAGASDPELLHRLAELYWEKAQALTVRQFQGAAQKKARDVVPQLITLEKKVFGLYDEILKKFPGYRRTDQVLFNAASAEEALGHRAMAEALYERLIRELPQSDLVGDAYFALGEGYFAANDLPRAESAYEQAVRTKKSAIVPFALYKLAWCDYNAQRYAAALEKFKQVARLGDKSGGVSLKDEALSDALFAFSQLEEGDAAQTYLTSELAPEEFVPLLWKLAMLYNDQGKFDHESRLLTWLLQKYPKDTRAPEFQAALLGATYHLGRDERLLVAARPLADEYGPKGAWALAQTSDPAALGRGLDQAERALRETATAVHSEAQRTRDDRSYRVAASLYALYLQAFSDRPVAYKLRFNAAEILFRQRDYVAAAAQYDLVVAANDRGPLLVSAARSAVFAWELQVDRLRPQSAERKISQTKTTGTADEWNRLKKQKEGGAESDEPLTDDEQHLADACARFCVAAPADADAAKFKFKEARLYFMHRHFSEANERFLQIVLRWPSHPLAVVAATAILEGYNARSDWVSLTRAVTDFRANAKLMRDVGFAKTLNGYAEGVAFKLAEQKESHAGAPSAPAQSASAYLAYADEFSNSRYADTALYNAVVKAAAASRLDLGIAAARRLLQQYPKSSLGPDTLYYLAHFYDQSGDAVLAQKAYETYLKNNPAGAHAADAGWNSAVLLEALGQNADAKEAYASYRRRFAKGAEALSAYQAEGKILERLSEWKKAEAHWAAYSSSCQAPCSEWTALKPRLFALIHLAKAQATLHSDGALAEATYAKVTQAYFTASSAEQSDEDARYFAAQALYEGSAQGLKKFSALKLGEPKTQAATLQAKAKLLNALEAKMVRVVSLGQGDWGIAALTRIGLLYEELAQSLLTAKLPSGLAAAQKQQYQTELSNRAVSLQEKSVTMLQKAVDKSRELHLYTRSSAIAEQHLGSLSAARVGSEMPVSVLAPDRFAPTPIVLGVPPVGGVASSTPGPSFSHLSIRSRR